VELLLGYGGRGLLDKLRVQLQYQEDWDVFLCVHVHDRRVGRHAWMMKGDHVFGKQT
jgi:hypothetical protein